MAWSPTTPWLRSSPPPPRRSPAGTGAASPPPWRRYCPRRPPSAEVAHSRRPPAPGCPRASRAPGWSISPGGAGFPPRAPARSWRRWPPTWAPTRASMCGARWTSSTASRSFWRRARWTTRRPRACWGPTSWSCRPGGTRRSRSWWTRWCCPRCRRRRRPRGRGSARSRRPPARGCPSASRGVACSTSPGAAGSAPPRGRPSSTPSPPTPRPPTPPPAPPRAPPCRVPSTSSTSSRWRSRRACSPTPRWPAGSPRSRSPSPAGGPGPWRRPWRRSSPKSRGAACIRTLPWRASTTASWTPTCSTSPPRGGRASPRSRPCRCGTRWRRASPAPPPPPPSPRRSSPSTASKPRWRRRCWPAARWRWLSTTTATRWRPGTSRPCWRCWTPHTPRRRRPRARAPPRPFP
mmetsp:Transcript_30675/g.97960  ORF Transcript_30675/g.97960 Transcript_30675/m.97960 type:complete len:405 (-) Transcript_30675:521-1735(-)